MKNNTKKTGFVSLIGRPSSGKSTLINAICGYKISIVSDHPQTTQFIVRGIYNDKESQIIFIDTPGYHHFDSNLNRGLSNLAIRTLNDGDLILYLVDISRNFGNEEKDIIKQLKLLDKNIIIVFNKIDLNSSNQEAIKTEIKSRLNPKIVIEISAKTKENVDELIGILKQNLDIGPLYYPDDYVTDQSIPFRIQELVREKVFINTKNELPHSTYVDIESLNVKEKRITANAIIYIERESQKGMIIGNKGKMIKKIGEQARAELKEIFERDVNLFLRVKVHYKWRRENKFLKKKFNLV
ncbi:MAG: GTPase Era [Spirochaetes bacterium]|nr:GTPase Era [Spirochaetota bacterium]